MTAHEVVDSLGRLRPCCELSVRGDYWNRHRADAAGHVQCLAFAGRQLPDGRWVCAVHDPDRRAGWVMCSQAVAWDARGRPSRTCGHRARFVAADDGGWFCARHDPERPRCSNVAAHAVTPARLSELGIDVEGLGRGVDGRGDMTGVFDPRTPTAARKVGGVRLCRGCLAAAGRGELRRAAAPTPRGAPCVLCRGTKCLETDRGLPFPCLCTPGGREIANGAPDRVVLARLVASGHVEADRVTLRR